MIVCTQTRAQTHRLLQKHNLLGAGNNETKTRWRTGLAIKQSWVQFPVGLLSSYLGQLSLPSLRRR